MRREEKIEGTLSSSYTHFISQIGKRLPRIFSLSLSLSFILLRNRDCRIGKITNTCTSRVYVLAGDALATTFTAYLTRLLACALPFSQPRATIFHNLHEKTYNLRKSISFVVLFSVFFFYIKCHFYVLYIYSFYLLNIFTI